MSEEGSVERCRRRLRGQGDVQVGYQVAAVVSRYTAAKYLISVRVNHCFDESTSLADLDRPRYVSHGQLGNTDIAVLCTRFGFTQPHSPQLRIDKHGVWHKPLAGRRISSLEQIGSNDPKVII